MADLHIVHLYHDLMNIYGDRGNILALTMRCRWRNLSIKLSEVSLQDEIPNDADILFFGGGQDEQQQLVSSNLQQKKSTLKEMAEKSVVMLSICGGYQLFGKFYRPHKGAELPGIGIFDAETIAGDRRMIGNIVIVWNKTTIVGFENHSGKTYLRQKTKPLGQVVIGFGNNGEDHSEGAVYKNVYGCYLHGSLLPKNPILADSLIAKALQRKTRKKIRLLPLPDTIEEEAHKAAILRARQTE